MKYILFVLLLTIVACKDVEKIEAENLKLKLESIKFKQNIEGLNSEVSKLKTNVLEAKQEKYEALASVNKDKAKLEEKVITLQSDEGNTFKRLAKTVEEKRDSGKLVDFIALEKELRFFVKMYPKTDYFSQITGLLKEVEKLKGSSDAVAASEKIIKEAIVKREYNVAYKELNKMSSFLSAPRYSTHVAAIAAAKESPIILTSMENFWNKARTGMWVDQKYALFAFWDNTGKKICSEKKSSKGLCSSDDQTAIDAVLAFKKDQKKYLELKGKSVCVGFIFKRKSVYIYKVTPEKCAN